MISLFTYITLALFQVNTPVPVQESTCLECHAQAQQQVSPSNNASAQGTISAETISPAEKKIDTSTLASSSHSKLACLECHKDGDKDHKNASLSPVDCSECHEKSNEAFKTSVHAQKQTKTDRDISCTDCHGTHDIYAAKDPRSKVFPSRLPTTCGECHGIKNEKSVGNGNNPWAYTSYTMSIHYKALTESGLIVSATCVNCHGSHDIRSRTDQESTVYRKNVSKTCSACHEGQYKDWSVSIHGQSVKDGNLDAPVCTSCHGEHEILARDNPNSTVAPLAISVSTCSRCHGADSMNRKYGIQATNVTTYEDSFHGMASKFGDPSVANCASCHGSHRIFPSSDPQSTVNSANLPKTCGACHIGAGTNFAIGSIHQPMESKGGFWLSAVKNFYIWMIILTISGMFFHNLLDYLKKLIEYNKSLKNGWVHQRFTLMERIQHVLLVISFAVLVITGFALKYPDAFWVQPLVDLKMGFLVRAYAHRIAALINMALCVFHLFYLIFTARGRDQVKAMMPNMQDARDLLHQMRYYIGLEKHSGNFGRYSYVEKSEYLALAWGTCVMVVTGLILWFEESALHWMPKWGWDLSELIHFYEAWLATLAILVWHIYHVALKPSGHGFTMAMVTGNLAEDLMQHEHPAEYREIKRSIASARDEKVDSKAPDDPDESHKSPSLGGHS